MLHKSNFSIETAVANCSGAMEAETIQINAVSPKNHRSRMLLVTLFLSVFSGFAFGQTFKFTLSEGRNTLPSYYYIDLTNNEIRKGLHDNIVETYKIKTYKIEKSDDELDEYIGKRISFFFELEFNEQRFDFCLVAYNLSSKKYHIGFANKKNSNGNRDALPYISEFEFDEFLKIIETKKR